MHTRALTWKRWYELLAVSANKLARTGDADQGTPRAGVHLDRHRCLDRRSHRNSAHALSSAAWSSARCRERDADSAESRVVWFPDSAAFHRRYRHTHGAGGAGALLAAANHS